MKKIILFFFLFIAYQFVFGQPNCQVLKDSLCIKACQLSIEASNYQGAKYSQELFDKAIKMCPSFAYAYYEKSVPYLKHGFISNWKKIIDKAVELEPESYLINRGCNQIQFFRNYRNGIKDLEQLSDLVGTFNIGYTNSGEYHAQMIRAIAYRKIDQIEKSIAIMEELINSDWYHQSLFDYFHIGISYLEVGQLMNARKAFEIQNQENELAETYFYYSKIYEKQNKFEQAIKMLIKSKELYKNGQIMSHNYYQYLDKIFYAEIEENLIRLENENK